MLDACAPASVNERPSKGKMLASNNLICCNYRIFNLKPNTLLQVTRNPSFSRLGGHIFRTTRNIPTCLKPNKQRPSFVGFHKRSLLQVCRSSLNSEEDEVSGEGLKEERDWTSSILLLLIWVALMYYVFNLAPNQTPSTDTYFLKKLLNLKGDDGFRMNQILVSLWYIMGLWPLLYSMLLLPTGRSSKSKIPVWPFLVLSFIGGAYALLPYSVVWKPPPPPVDEADLEKWPLNFLEWKLTAAITLAAGLGLILYAALLNSGDWAEFNQYFRESRLVHVTSLDFSLLSAFSPFWVYNDMTARKWLNKGWWLLPVSMVPFVGPALYLTLRPPLSEAVGSASD